MPIDTSSYYPEIDGPDGEKREDSLNGRYNSLFGEQKNEDKAHEQGYIEKKQQPSEDNSSQDNKLNKAIDNISHLLSWIFVPLIMPVYAIILIFRLSILDVIPAGLQTAVTFVIAGINFVAPMLLILLLKMLGVIQDVGLNGRKERLIPYIITAICYGCSAWFVASRGAPIWVIMFFFGGSAASIINLLINLKWKISAHAAAIAGIIALLIRLQRDVAVEPQLFVWILITVGCTGLLGSARIWLNRHTVWQVLAGYVVGFCSVFFLMSIH